MIEPVSVLILVGGMTFGPFAASEQEIKRWDERRAVSTCEPLRMNEVVNGISCSSLEATQVNWELLCRRVLEDFGVGGRKAISGHHGWMTQPTGWLGRNENIELQCIPAGAGYRK